MFFLFILGFFVGCIVILFFEFDIFVFELNLSNLLLVNFLSVFIEWCGVFYCLGGNSKNGIDCLVFV